MPARRRGADRPECDPYHDGRALYSSCAAADTRALRMLGILESPGKKTPSQFTGKSHEAPDLRGFAAKLGKNSLGELDFTFPTWENLGSENPNLGKLGKTESQLGEIKPQLCRIIPQLGECQALTCPLSMRPPRRVSSARGHGTSRTAS